jgi:AcrR family transcriptional regulator
LWLSPDTRHNPDVKTVAPRNPRRLTRAEAQSLTRGRLIDAAAEVFREQGFLQASLADVADRAGYTIGAVYSNFSSKDDLFFAVMRDRLHRVEAALSAALPADGGAVPGESETVDQRITRELDRLAAAEDAVPPGWWRLLFEFRVHAAEDPVAWAELAESERRCREIIARHIERFATSVGIVLPLAAIELAELTSALTDGLRAAYAEGRSSLTSGQGLRLVVAAFIATSRRVGSD